MWNKAREPIRLLMTPGPVEVSPRVLSALARPQIYHYYKGFVDFFADTTEKIKRIYQTKDDVIIMQGEGVLGLEAAVVNIVNQGDKILVLENGPFGKWFGSYVENAGGIPIYLSSPNNEAFQPERLKEKLDTENDIKAMTVVHCETPAGILNPVEKLCPIAKKKGIVTIVDAVASLGGIDVRPNEWGMDFCISASQKALSSSAGLTTLSVSRDGWDAIDSKKKPVRNSYLSISDYRDSWLKNSRFPFTPMVSEIYGLNEAADELLEEGLQNSFNRHRVVAEACRDSAERDGFKLWAKRPEDAANTVTALQVPSGTNDTEIVSHMVQKYGILIGGGYKETKGELLRVGHMGYQATLTNIMTTMAALEKTLSEIRTKNPISVPAN